MSTYVVEAQLKATGGSQFAEAFEQASNSVNSLKDVGSQLSGIGKSLTAGLTVPIVGFGAAATKTVMEFDDTMAGVQKISGATEKEFAKLRDEAKRLGSTTAYSASEAADGMGILASSGLEVNKIIDISADMFNLMSAGTIDAETSARVLTNTMAQFNLESEDSKDIVNAFASGAAVAKVDVEGLEHAMALAGSSLSNMNMSAEDSVAVMGQLANGAVPVEQLGSTVNAMTRDIIANSEEMEEFVDVYDSATGDIRGLDDILNDYTEATKNMTQEEKNAADQLIFTGKAQQGVNAWVNQGAEGYKKLTEEMKEMGNAAEVMAAIQEDTLGGSFRAVSSAMEGLMIEVGDIIKGPLQELALKFVELSKWFGGLSEGQQKMVVAIGLIAAAIGPIIMIIGSLITSISAIAGAVGVLMGPVGLILAGIAAVIAIGVALYKNWDEIIEKVDEVKESFNKFVESSKERFTEFADSVVELKDSTVDKFTEMKDGVVSKFTEMGASVKETKDNIVNYFVDLKDGIVQRLRDVIDTITNFKSDIVNAVKDINLLQAGKDIIGGFIDGLKGKWEDGKAFIGGIGGWIKDNKGPAAYDKKLLVEAGNLIIDGLNRGMMDSFSDVQSNVHGMGAAIQDALSSNPTMDINGSIARTNDQVNAAVHHSLAGQNDKSPQVIHLSLGGRDFRAFVEDISEVQDSEIRLEEAYNL